MLILLGGLALAICACTRPTPSNTVPRVITQIPPFERVELPDGRYTHAVFLDEDRLVANHENEDARDPLHDMTLLFFDIASAEAEYANLPDPEGSVGIVRASTLERLQPSRVGAVVTYYFFEEDRLLDRRLYAWRTASEDPELIVHYPPSFNATDLAFSPDTSQGLQQGDGSGLSNTLYLIDEEMQIIPLFERAGRAGIPAWSSDGSEVAFALSGQGVITEVAPFEGGTALGVTLDSPWTIYISDPQFEAITPLLDEVVGLYDIQFSPDGSLLGFNASNFEGSPGVFILDRNSGLVTRIWETNTDFDWAPSGNTMLVMVDDPNQENSIYRVPVLLDMSEWPTR